MSDSTLTVVLVDLHLASTRAEHEGTRIERDSILRHHGVEPAAFTSTLDYYSHRPGDYARLYESVIDSLRSLRNAPYRPSAQTGNP